MRVEGGGQGAVSPVPLTPTCAGISVCPHIGHHSPFLPLSCFSFESISPSSSVAPGIPWWLRQQRICPQCRRSGFNPCVRKIPWSREQLPTPVFLPGEFHGVAELNMTETHTHTHQWPQSNVGNAIVTLNHCSSHPLIVSSLLQSLPGLPLPQDKPLLWPTRSCEAWGLPGSPSTLGTCIPPAWILLPHLSTYLSPLGATLGLQDPLSLGLLHPQCPAIICVSPRCGREPLGSH